eukprot:scaffold19980_cov26-Tisochrysis_lutea.AAC.2
MSLHSVADLLGGVDLSSTLHNVQSRHGMDTRGHPSHAGIYDIGAVVPAEVQGFYIAQGFEKDSCQGYVAAGALVLQSCNLTPDLVCVMHPT